MIGMAGSRLGGAARLSLVALVAFFAFAASAHAAFPGANGRIAFGAIGEIYSVNPDGTGFVNLTNTPDQGSEREELPAWSPDGTKIAFMSNRDDQFNYEIYVMNADGSNPTRLTSNSAHDHSPTWSPDGTKIAFGRSTSATHIRVMVMNSDGTGEVELADPRAFGASSTGHLQWSPDGTKLAFHDIADIWVMSADGASFTKLTSYPPTRCCEEQAADPTWSPDSQKIAFSQDYLTGDISTASIEVINADGSGRQRLTPVDGVDRRWPAWSPDGSLIVFYDMFSDEAGGFTFINPGGSVQSSISNGGSDPDWQPLPGPQRNDFKNSAQFCKAKRTFMGESAFGQTYGNSGSGANPFGKCVSANGRK
jgi:Tol biopolymer transport system component